MLNPEGWALYPHNIILMNVAAPGRLSEALQWDTAHREETIAWRAAGNGNDV